MSYLVWQEKQLNPFSLSALENLYSAGFVTTRRGKEIAEQTRSLRIDLHRFSLSSENRRILKKTEGLDVHFAPLPYPAYHWSIGKLAKDFYTEKFGDHTFSANKLKDLLTRSEMYAFNRLGIYSFPGISDPIGYAVCLATEHALHYAYPFYRLPDTQFTLTNVGLGMMLRAILWAKMHEKEHIYLGSAQRPSDVYKLQFTGLEWFDGQTWQTDIPKLKKILETILVKAENQ